MLKIKPLKEIKSPSKAHSGDAGWDVYSLEDKLLHPNSLYRFKLGFAIIGIPGKVYQVEGKSGLAEKGLTTIGNVIDNQYRGEVSALLINLSNTDKFIEKGDKIAQILVKNVEDDNILIIDTNPLTLTDRGEKAYGSSGKN